MLIVLQTDRKKKESIFELSKFLDKTVRVKFQGGREGAWKVPTRGEFVSRCKITHNC